ncbi:transmembrane signal receptor [Lithospermum erythrorhizon]|uniref:Transmembrane signal receptor n=1 Tax=Lithospermum erythrorhizon TaxID=34254 RepID=A0AAV3PPK1_LITER
MLGCKPNTTPVEFGNKDQMFKGESVDKTMYQQLVGKLIYLSHTRPDIAFAVSLVSQYMHNPCRGHLDAVYRILRYLKQSPENGLFFKKTEDRTIKVFTDTDWAGSIDDRKSTSGYCTVIWGNLVRWRSKKQNVVARSSGEVKFRSMAHEVCEVVWIKRLYEELDMKYDGPIQLYCDNQSAISIAHNPVQHDRTKHVEVDRHFIKEKIENKIIKIEYVHTGQQLADILTKGLSELSFNVLLGKLGLIDIYRPA